MLVLTKRKHQLFNNYFYSVFSTDSDTPVSEPPISTSTGTLYDIETNESEVLTILSSLDGNKACGIDDICPRVYSHCALPLLKPICHLFAVSLSSGSIPSQWCTHWITPIYKSGDKSLVSNYRPISILCILLEVLERVVYNNILNYLERSFKCHQFGFLPGQSAVQQLLLFTERPLEAKLMQAEVDVVYMDFKESFDSVSRDGLLQKHHAAGITGKLWFWLQSYLKHCFQYVRIGVSNSTLCKVLLGVPQCSVLGPLLFIIFIDNLPRCTNSATPFIFADDTKCLLAINQQVIVTNSNVTSITYLSEAILLAFNESKFVHLRFWQKVHLTHLYTYVINGNLIRQMFQHKDLGVTFPLTFIGQNTTTPLLPKLTKLQRIFNVNSITAKKQLHISLV